MTENKKTRILIVDDDETVRSNYVEIFKKEGFEVEEAVDGLQGFDKATKNIPDVIFTGIVMPRMDGFGLMESLKKNVATANIPIIISSHLGRSEDHEKAKKLGVKDFIILHMVTPKEATERVRKVLGGMGNYKLKIDTKELDAIQMAKDNHFKEDYKCSQCGADLILKLSVSDISNHNLTGHIVCPKCGRI
ncbi:MAG TPA: response regulator [Patescibacteria group bacterium]|nr:response regulator [Patescibacteria group bacterium]